MEQSKPLEEIDVWNQPPSSRIVLNEERNKEIFQENQTDFILQTLFKMTQHAMTRKLQKISGLLREISFCRHHVEPESNCTCREKNHFLFRRSTLTYPEQHIRHWMYCWKTFWRLLERRWRSRIVRCMDRFHTIYYLLNERPPVRGETDEETNDLKTWQCMARYVEAYVWCIETQSKAKVGYRETKARQCQKITWYLLQWTKWWII